MNIFEEYIILSFYPILLPSYSNSFTRPDLTVRDTTIRAIAASRQHKPINPALIANAVFISIALNFTVDAIFFSMSSSWSLLYFVLIFDFRKKIEITQWIANQCKISYNLQATRIWLTLCRNWG